MLKNYVIFSQTPSLPLHLTSSFDDVIYERPLFICHYKFDEDLFLFRDRQVQQWEATDLHAGCTNGIPWEAKQGPFDKVDLTITGISLYQELGWIS